MTGIKRQCIAKMDLPEFDLRNLNSCSITIVNILNERSSWDAVINGDCNSPDAIVTIEKHMDKESDNIVEISRMDCSYIS